jgi:hypothetical protein
VTIVRFRRLHGDRLGDLYQELIDGWIEGTRKAGDHMERTGIAVANTFCAVGGLSEQDARTIISGFDDVKPPPFGRAQFTVSPDPKQPGRFVAGAAWLSE